MMLATPAGTRGNALAARLSHYLPLTSAEQVALSSIQRPDRRVAAGDTLIEQGGPVDSLFVVQQGWLHSSLRIPARKDATGGGRQILHFHYSGDLIGTSSIAWSRAAATLTAVSDCIVADVPKAALGKLFGQEERLGGLLYAVAAAENVALSDRLTSIG